MSEDATPARPCRGGPFCFLKGIKRITCDCFRDCSCKKGSCWAPKTFLNRFVTSNSYCIFLFCRNKRGQTFRLSKRLCRAGINRSWDMQSAIQQRGTPCTAAAPQSNDGWVIQCRFIPQCCKMLYNTVWLIPVQADQTSRMEHGAVSRLQCACRRDRQTEPVILW